MQFSGGGAFRRAQRQRWRITLVIAEDAVEITVAAGRGNDGDRVNGSWHQPVSEVAKAKTIDGHWTAVLLEFDQRKQPFQLPANEVNPRLV